MRWRYFWVALAIFLGCFRVYKIDKLVNEPNNLTNLVLVGIILSGLFIIYFIGEKVYTEYYQE